MMSKGEIEEYPTKHSPGTTPAVGTPMSAPVAYVASSFQFTHGNPWPSSHYGEFGCKFCPVQPALRKRKKNVGSNPGLATNFIYSIQYKDLR